MKQNCTSHFLLVIFIAVSTSVYAQMIPMTTTIKTPYGNVPHTHYVGSMHNYYGQQNVSVRYDFVVVLKNDSTFKTKTRINLTEDEDNSITVKRKGIKEQIFPDDTRYISRVTSAGKVLKGIPADSCWLFKIIDGEINGYAFLAEEMDVYIIAIQGGSEGQILPLTKENLMPLILSDQKSVVLARKNKLRRAVIRYNHQARLRQGNVSR